MSELTNASARYPDPDLVAVHEAGHAVGAYLGRARIIESISIEPDPSLEGNLGSCRSRWRDDFEFRKSFRTYWSGQLWFNAVELLSGPIAQLELLPESLGESLNDAKNSVIFRDAGYEKASKIASSLNWLHDILPFWSLILTQERGLYGGFEDNSKNIELQVRQRFSERSVKAAIRELAESVKRSKTLSGSEATGLLRDLLTEEHYFHTPYGSTINTNQPSAQNP